MFDFPSSPAEGDIYSPPGGPQYVWNDPVWNVVPAGGGGVEEAPVDTKTYGRKDADWVEVTSGGGSVVVTPAMFKQPTDPDDTLSLQAVFDASATGFIPAGTYTISEPLRFRAKADFSGRGKRVIGDGRRKVVIQNTTNASPLVTFGDTTSNWDGLDCELANVSLKGNAATLYGIGILGDDDDGLTQASRNVRITDVRVSDVGSGPALRVGAWRPIVSGFEAENNLRGIDIGQHVYTALFEGFYNVSCVNEAVRIDASVAASKANSIIFVNPVLQHGGASGQLIDLQGGGNVQFIGTYIEVPDNAATALWRIGSAVRSVSINGFHYSRGSSTALVNIIDTQGQGVELSHGVVYGDVQSFAKIAGNLPFTHVENIQQPSGTKVLAVDDQSTRKVTFVRNAGGTTGLDLPTSFKALSTQPALAAVDSATDAIKWFVQNGRAYWGADTTALNLSVAGSTMVLNTDTGYGTWRAEAFRLGTTNAKYMYRTTGTPEGNNAADPGSLCAVQDAGLYYKDSGTGATGWIKLSNSGGGGIADAPSDGKPYARKDAGWDDLTDDFAAKAALAGATFTGLVNTVASVAGGAGLNIGAGAAPTSPAAGDFWMSSVGNLQWRSSSTTFTAVNTSSAQTLAGVKTFSSSPILPTPTAGDNSTAGATTAFVTTAIAAKIANKITVASTAPSSPATNDIWVDTT